MKKIFCLIALMIATVSLASAQLIGAYSFAKSDGTFVGISGGNALDLSAVKYVPADGDTKAVNEAVTFAYGADGLVTGTSLTDIKGLPLGFDFEFNGTQMKYFAMNGTGVIYLSDTESFQVTPSQSFNALTASASASSVPALGLTCNQSKVRITDATEISYQVTGSEGNHVFLAQYRDVEQATNFNGTTTVKTNFQVKLYEAAGKVEIILGEWTIASGTIPGVRIGLAGLNGDMLNLKGSIAAPEAAASTNSISSVNPSTIVAGTTYTFNQPAPCVTPTAQPTNLVVEELTSVSATGSFTAAESGVDQYLVVLLQGDATFTPADGETYAAKDNPAEGVYVLAFAATNTYRTQTLGNEFLIPSTDYTVRAYAANTKCKGGPLYNLNEPAEVKFTTCLDKPASLTVVPASPTAVKISVAADAKGDQVLVAVNENPQLNSSTQYPEDYGAFGTPTGTYKVGDVIDGGGLVVYVGPAKDNIVIDGFTTNQPVYVNAWSTDGAGNYGTICQEARTSTELQLPYAADYHKMGTYMEPAGYIVNDEYLSGSASVMTGADGHTATNGFTWKSSGAAGADDMAEGTVTLPSFQIPAAGARMSFDYQIYIWGRMSNSPVQWIDHALEVQLSENGTDYETIYAIDENNQPETVDVAFHTYNINKEAFAKYAGKKVTLRFKWSRYSDAYSFIQNIFIEEAPAIDYPTDLAVTAVDGGNVTIDWTDRYAEAAKWEVRYKKADTTSWSTPVATTEKPYTITGLDLSSTYDIQVRVVVDEQVSPWAETSTITGLGAPYSITYAALPFEDGWAAKQWEVAEGATTVTFTDDATTNWRFNTNYGLMYSGNYNRAIVTPSINLGETEKLYTISFVPGRAVTSLKTPCYIAVSKDNGATWKLSDAVDFDGNSSVEMNLSGNVQIALCLLKGNTSFYLKSFSIEATYETGLAGKSVVDYSTKAATVQPRTWYVLTQKRNGETPAYDKALGEGIMRAPANFSIPKGANAEEYAQYLVRLLPTQYEGVYNLQWGNGNFLGADLKTVATAETAGMYKIYNINGEETHFGINVTADGTTLGQPVDNNGAGNTISFWGSGEVTSINGNNDWWFYPVEFGSYDPAQSALNDEFNALVAQVEKTLAKNDLAQVGDNLITEASQFSSNYSDSDEGKSFDALLDSDVNTYWHTDWHSVPAEGTHPSLEIALAEPISGDIQITLQRRNCARDHVTGLQVLTSTDGTTYTETATVALPFTAKGEVVSGVFNLPEAVKYLSIYSTGNISSDGVTVEDPVKRNYWHAAEIQLNKYISATPINEKYPEAADALHLALGKAKLTENATEATIAALQAALDTYLLSIVPKPYVLGPDDISDEKAYIIYTEARGGLTVTDAEATALKGTGESGVGQTVEDTNVLQQFAFVGYEGNYYLYNLGAQKYVSISGLTEKAANPIQFADADESTVRLLFDASHNFNLGGSKQFTCDSWKYKDAGNSFIIKAVADFDQSDLIAAIAADIQQSKLNADLAEVIAQAQAAYDIHNIAGDALIHEADQFSSPYTTTDDQCDDIDEVYTYLLDNDPKTYWHSAWEEGEQPMHTHYLQVNLAELVDGDMLLQMTRRNVLGNHITKMSVEASTDGVDFTQVAAFDLAYEKGGEVVSAEFKLDSPATFLRFFADETQGNQANLGYWHAAEFQLFKAIELPRNVINADVAAGLMDAINAAKAVENATQEDIDALVQALSVYNANIMNEPEPEPVNYVATMITADEVNAIAVGESLTLLLGTAQKGQFSSSEGEAFGWNNSGIAITDDELATTNANTAANTEACRFVFTKTAEGFTIMNKDGKYVGYNADAIVVGDTPMTWTVVSPQPDGETTDVHVNLDEYNWLNNGIDLKYSFRIITSEGYYPQCNQAGLSKNQGGWTVLLAWNVTEETEPAPTTYTYTINLVNAPADGAYLQIDGNWYMQGETVESDTELTPEDVTVSCDPAYTYEVTIAEGVITVTFQQSTVGINGINGDAKNAAIYSIQGQRILNANRGVNIKNGKKVLVK